MEMSGGSFGVAGVGMDEAYRPLSSVYLGFILIWLLSALSWTINTWNNRHFQSNNLQWTLASVPLIKLLQLTLSFLFWYSCFNFQTCSLWMSFGVYVTGALFQTTSFVSFLLISHGYCVMCEHLSVPERRTTAALACVFYLTLVGYRASVPYFTVLLLLSYFISFYVIFHHISQNLLLLREQLSFVQDEDMHTMRDAVYTKYTMFKKFRSAMQIVAMAETMVYINTNETSDDYWLRVLVREWAQFCIFLYIGLEFQYTYSDLFSTGVMEILLIITTFYLDVNSLLPRWTFRSQEFSPSFSVMPNQKSKGQNMVPPIYSIEMDAAEFKDFSSHEWHIGLPTSSPPHAESYADSFLVIVQHPRAQKATSGSSISLSLAAGTTVTSTKDLD